MTHTHIKTRHALDNTKIHKHKPDLPAERTARRQSMIAYWHGIARNCMARMAGLDMPLDNRPTTCPPSIISSVSQLLISSTSHSADNKRRTHRIPSSWPPPFRSARSRIPRRETFFLMVLLCHFLCDLASLTCPDPSVQLADCRLANIYTCFVGCRYYLTPDIRYPC